MIKPRARSKPKIKPIYLKQAVELFDKHGEIEFSNSKKRASFFGISSIHFNDLDRYTALELSDFLQRKEILHNIHVRIYPESYLEFIRLIFPHLKNNKYNGLAAIILTMDDIG